jgi:Ca2+-binding RTX toxin-like protein
MAVQHLYVYTPTTTTETGKEFIEGVQYLWTGGRTSIYSRALSLINNGEGIGPYANGNWSQTNTHTWPSGNWDQQWVSDDGNTTVKSKNTTSVWTATTWKETAKHSISVLNGDTFTSTATYNSQHKLTSGGVYYGGDYSGGHSITFEGVNGTPLNKADDEKAVESNSWVSKVAYDSKGIRSENIKSTNKFSYSSALYEVSWDSKIEQNWGLEDQTTLAYVKYDQSGNYVIKDISFDTASYKFKDKTSGFEFSFTTKDKLNFVTNKSELIWTNVSIKSADLVITGKSVKITDMTAEAVDKINFGSEIGENLAGVEQNINDIILPFINFATDEVLEFDNGIIIGTSSGLEVDAGAGNDTVTGNSGADDITGGAGNDSINGGNGNDTLFSGAGNDMVMGGEGADLIVGGDGAGNDTYDGGKGIDTVRYTSAKAGIRIDLSKGTAKSIATNDAAGIGSDKLIGIENIISGDFADFIVGSNDANSILGGAGNDTINGGLGNDTLMGGDGADVFVFNSKPAANNLDTISDFVVGVDKIQLSVTTFAKLKGASNYFVMEAPTTATQYLIYNSATGKLSYDADGSGTKSSPIEIAIVGTGLSLTAADFVIS